MVPFGSNGDLTAIPIPTQGDGQESYNQGFTVNYQQDLIETDTALPISRAQFNQLMFDITNNIQQYQTFGTPLWITAAQNDNGSGPTPFSYGLYARVAYDAGSGLQIWENQVSGNTNTPGPLSTTGWVLCNVSSVGVPAGTIIDFGGSSVPSGYLPCDGTQRLISAYPNLYSAIGLLWQPALPPTSGYFNLPLLQTYVCAGAGGAGIPIPAGTLITVGNLGGTPNVGLTIAQMPAHSHSGTGGSNTGTPSTQNVWGGGGSSSPAKPSQVLGGTPTTNSNLNITLQGSGATHTNVQPTAITLKCIKY